MFGLVRGVLLVAVAWMLMTWALPNPDERPSYLREAKSARLVAATATTLENALPASLRSQGQSAADQTKQGAQDAQRAKDAYDALSQPEPESDSPSAAKPAYPSEDRKQMDRLIESQTSNGGSGGE